MNGRIKQLDGDLFFDDVIDIYVNRELESFSTEQHTHDFIEISVVEEGNGYHYIEDQVLPVKQGDIFLIPIGTSHVFRPSSTRQEKQLVICNCIFKTSLIQQWERFFPEQSDLLRLLLYPEQSEKRWLQYHDKHDKFLPMIATMHREYLNRFSGFETILTTLLIQMLAMLQRIELNEETEIVQAPQNQLDEVIHFIEKYHAKNITVQYVAEYFYMSSSHFQRLFKKMMGLTFIEYLQNVRIQKCCQLLKSTNHSIHQIANKVGYRDMKFFHALFRKKTGVTPGQYRKRFQENEDKVYSMI